MAQKNINIGSGELVGDGESIRSAFDKINQNFGELYAGEGTAEVNDLTQAVVWANVPDINITQSSVTQHQAAISITESQISDLQNYLTSYTETNDLTSAVTWANVPDVNITQSSVTQHQAAISITESQISDLTHYTDSDVDANLNTSTATANQILSWTGTDYDWISQEEVDVLGSFSVTAPAAAFGSGGIDYNSTNGQFTYTPPDLSNFLSAETDTFQTVTTRGNTTTNEVELNGGVKTNNVQSANGVHSIGFNEANDLTIGSTGGVKIIGAAAAPLELGTETTGTVTIGSGSNNIVFASTITGNVNGNVTGDLVGSVFADDSTLLVDAVNNTIPKAVVEDSTNWDTAFGWGDHATAGYLTSETTTTLGINANILKYTDETGAETDIDLSLYLDDTNLARLTTGTLNGATGIATFTRDDATTFTVDFSDLLNQSETNDLTASVTWANVPDANITQSSVTQHQAALSITESQISDLQSYLTSYTETNDLSTAVTWANVPDINITESSVTQHQAALSITESQISDLQSYLTSYTETNDLSTAVTWANVPDANITQSSVTQHQAALSITESQISDLQSYLTAETDPVYLAEKGQPNGVATLDATGIIPSSQLPSYVDDVLSYANFAAFPVTGETGKIYVDQATGDIFRWDGVAAYIQINDAVTSADQATQLATARDFSLTGDVTATAVSFNGTGDVALSTSVTQAAVTQHQAALSITESQISDLQSYLTAETDPVFTAHTTSSITDGTGLLKNDGAGNWSYDNSTYLTTETSHADVLVDGDFATAGFMKTDGAGNYTVDNSTYLTSYTETNDLSTAVTWANVPDANITESSVTQHESALTITESQISDLGSYLTDLTGSSVGTLSDVDFNSVTLDGANGQDKVLAWDQTAQAFVPVDQTNTNTTTFGLAGNTGTHTFDMVGETLTFLGATNQIDIEVATNFISVNLASVVDADIKGSVFADDSSLLVNGVDGTLAYTATTPTDWNGTAPTTVGEAIDRLATLVKTLNGGTGA